MSVFKFRHPSEMQVDESRTPVSARVNLSTKERLEEVAKKSGLSLGQLISNILDDYLKWLEKNPVKQK